MRLEEIQVARKGERVYFNYGGGKGGYLSGSGRGDALFAFRDTKEKRYYLLCENLSLPYCGLEVFDFGDPDPVFDVFLQESHVEETLGKKGLDYAPRTIVRKLLEGWEG